MTTQTIQIIKQDQKGAEFSGSAPCTWIGTLKKATLSISASSYIEEVHFNEMIAFPKSSAWSADVTKVVRQGENYLRVKVEYTPLDVLWGTTKTVNAVLTLEIEGVGGGLSYGGIQDIISKLSVFWGEVKGWSQWILLGIFIIAIILALAYLLMQAGKIKLGGLV